MSLDYSKLDELNPVRIKSDKSTTSNSASPAASTALTLVIFIFLVQPVMVLLAYLSFLAANLIFSTSSSVLLASLIFSMLCVWAIWFIINNHKFQSNRVAVSNFAITNGFRYAFGGLGTKDQVYKFKGILGNSYQSATRAHVMYGEYKIMQFEHFTIYRFGLLKSYQVFEVQLSNNFPHIFLDSQHNNKFVSNIRHVFSEGQNIELEGDFPKYFNLYSAASPIDALRIMTPDFMKLLVDRGYRFDIEIVDDKLYIIQDNKLISSKLFKGYIECASYIHDSLNRNSRLYAKYDASGELG